MEKFSATITEAIEKLKSENKLSVQLFAHGTMQVKYYAPNKIDRQQPHEQDEIYVIASGNAEFYRDKEIITCNKGDVLFVPACMEHRFINFSEDFATWVIFYGEEKKL